MSTRGAIGFRINGKDKITYNHSDSYPLGVGVDVAEAARVIAKDCEQWIPQVAALRTTKGNPTKSDIARLASKFGDSGVGGGNFNGDDGWYCLLRKTQGKPLEMVKAGVFEDSASFMKDSLFCEWAYIINLDQNTVEVYKGFQTKVHAKGRYASRRGQKPYPGCEQTYYPVALVATFPIDSVTSNDMVKLEKELNEKE